MMAEVEKLATSTVATDIPSNSGGIASGSAVSNDASANAEYGTSPTQERSSNSHPHDSEYDTASDLEGAEEYDDDDDDEDELDDDDDLTDEDDVDDDDDDDDDVDDDADDAEADADRSISGVGAGSQEKVSEAEIQKKVDEDRSNPQYIPKRGTFYEHDDRMADGEGDGVIAIGDPVGVESGVASTAGNSKITSQSPSISHASKTMKKWQPASGVERWSHDRFEESEQQPKSRSELISAYGYDIRTEDAPPRARRRRRYARGPTKYSRNWEDESAYIKISNKERKPPRPSDFPALNERVTRKQRREPRERDDNGRDEKENRPERRRGTVNKSSVNERLNIAAGRSNQVEEIRDREDIRARISGRPKINSRQPAGSGRQPAMEFKPKGRNSKHTTQQPQTNNTHNNSRSDDRGYDRPQQQRGGQYQSGNQNSSINEQFQPKSSVKGPQSMSVGGATHLKQSQQFHGDNYSNNNNQTTKYNEQHGGYSQQHPQPIQQGVPPHHLQQQPQGLTQLRQSMSVKSTPPPSNLSQRLQQVQNRNDPSHVGSVQMHALATQNQQQLVMGQQSNPNAMLISAVTQQQQQQQQPQQQLIQPQSQEQRGPPKRYSSMRRSQHDTQHLAEPHTHQPQQTQMQQLHMQQPPQQTPQSQQLIMQDQHSILQANLLQQLYHQENLQAQMQALQVSQPAPAQPAKQPNYASVPPPSASTAQSQTYGNNPANAAYYVTDAYAATGPNPQAPPQPAQYAPQQPAFMAPTPPTAAALAYTSPPPPAPSALQTGPPSGVYTGPGSSGPPAAPNSNQNYSNYQNYNTVGGTTYFVPPAPTTSRPVVLPQRRPTNAIPILPPAEKNKQRGSDSSKEDSSKQLSNSNSNAAPIGSAENIDHIIDNMFVQRPVFQPPQTSALSARQSSSPSNSDSVSSNIGTTDTQTLNADDSSNASSNNICSNSAEINNSSSNAAVTDEVASTPSNVSSSENSSNKNPITAQE